MEREVAKLDYSPLRIFRKVIVEIQRSWIFPNGIRYRLLKLGGVKIKKSFVGRDVSFDTLRPDLVTIGEGCVITSGTKILTHFLNPHEHNMFLAPVVIGNRVFIGMNTVIANSVSRAVFLLNL